MYQRNNLIDAKRIRKYEKKYINKRACIFASYNKDGIISNDIIRYLKELKKYNDYIIFIADNPIIEKELKKISKIVDSYIFQKHGEYDFGSYKRGYFVLKELGVLNKIDALLFCNDSIKYVGKSLKNVFKQSIGHNFFGITSNTGGYKFNDNTYYSNIGSSHIQSYFYILSNEIFNSDWIEKFYLSIKKENSKINIIIKYEMGLSKLIKEQGYDIYTFYECIRNMDPYDCFLKPNIIKNQLFVKKILIGKEHSLFGEILKKIFSITKNEIGTHKVITILGIKINIRRHNK